MPTRSILAVSSLLLALFAAILPEAGVRAAEPSLVKLVDHGGQCQLVRNGKPYFIKGGGGGGPKDVLARCGGNSFRTWGIGPSTGEELDQAEKLGLTVSLGCWLGHKEQGFHYDDEAAVKRQFDEVKRAVMKFKDHPALLVWSLGNEMEMADDSTAMWDAIEDLARMVHQVDPSHPTMTVIAELGKNKVPRIQMLCPDIDIIGINSYGGGPSLATRYGQAGGKRPFIVTEFGPPGTWEIKMNVFGAAPELTSTEKAACYRETYTKSVLARPVSAWVPTRSRGDTRSRPPRPGSACSCPTAVGWRASTPLQELWSGKPPAVPCPVMKSLAVEGKQVVARGEKVRASVVLGAKGGPVKIRMGLVRRAGQLRGRGHGRGADGPVCRGHRGQRPAGGSRHDAQVGRDLPPLLFRPRHAWRSGRRHPADQGYRPYGARQAAGGQVTAGGLCRQAQGRSLCRLGLDGQHQGRYHGCGLRGPSALRQKLHQVYLRRCGQLGRRGLAASGQRLGRQARRIRPQRRGIALLLGTRGRRRRKSEVRLRHPRAGKEVPRQFQGRDSRSRSPRSGSNTRSISTSGTSAASRADSSGRWPARASR